MKGFKKIWGIWLLALLLVITAGCGATNNAKNTNNAGTTESAAQEQTSNNTTGSEQDAKTTTYPLTVKDSSGTEFTFESAPKRIVSLAPSETEGLFALGLDEQVVGVSDNDDYPEAVKDKPKMGGFQINVEAVVAAQPDLVMAASLIDPATVKSLTDLGIKVYQSNPKTVDEVIEHIKTVGQITDHQGEAEQVAKQMQDELNKVTEAVKGLTEDQKKKVYIEFSPGWTVGKGEFMDEMITLAGGVNVASDITGWSEINEENIIKANPDVILYAKSVVDENNQTLADIIKGRGGWNQISAIKEDRVVGLDDNLLSRPGPRVTQGLIEVAKAIYPDLIQ
ncbi:iron complex transport system substrate-binding protein [Fontibacillus panacisegetis]|uniref:Iron complex transport system substrate-binding protein n=1 Tax=Fontibacillus panacisegetis TaxID=670482 RepID=A0A1G7PXG0_9BACL|nr:cobalamin-binding protein [Fontibacillus panacisegetis]SDF90992.1 iron complex transport system substrate-binding protein [Fontibacillus panacisegetis]